MGHGLSVIGYRTDSEFPDFLLSPFHLFLPPFAAKNSAAVHRINPASHPDPIRGQKCLERSGSGFPDFLLSPFHLFRPALVQAAFAAYSLSVKLKFKDQMAVPSASVTST